MLADVGSSLTGAETVPSSRAGVVIDAAAGHLCTPNGKSNGNAIRPKKQKS